MHCTVLLLLQIQKSHFFFDNWAHSPHFSAALFTCLYDIFEINSRNVLCNLIENWKMPNLLTSLGYFWAAALREDCRSIAKRFISFFFACPFLSNCGFCLVDQFSKQLIFDESVHSAKHLSFGSTVYVVLNCTYVTMKVIVLISMKVKAS